MKNCFLSLGAIVIIAVVFSSFASAQIHQHAFVWSQSTGMIDLGTLSGTNSTASGINDSGVVVGWSDVAGHKYVKAFRWTRSGGLRALPDFGFGAYAFAINSSGQIAGAAFVKRGKLVYHAVRWESDGTIKDLGNLGGDTFAFAYGINDNGDVVGISQRTDGVLDAFLWTASNGMQALGLQTATGLGMNNLQTVAGSYQPQQNIPHPFLWTAASGSHDLGTLGGNTSYASGINAAEQVVGSSELSDDSTVRAFLWTRATGMRDLGTLGGSSSGASVINVRSQIAGALIWRVIPLLTL